MPKQIKTKRQKQWGPYAYDMLCDPNVAPEKILEILHICLYERHMDGTERNSLLRAIQTNPSWDVLTLERPTLIKDIKSLYDGVHKR